MNTSARGATAAQQPAAQAAAHVEGGNKNELRHISCMGNVLDPRVDSSKIPESGQGERQAPGASTTSSTNAARAYMDRTRLERQTLWIPASILTVPEKRGRAGAGPAYCGAACPYHDRSAYH
ncbi:hypothetical protein MANI_002624 [Metarhizium anisopliae]